MIRRRDQIRLSLQKLRLRKKRSVFSVISIALGVLVVVTSDSLIEGVRRAVTTTPLEQEMHPDEIEVSGRGNQVIEAAEEMAAAQDPNYKRKPKKRFVYLTNEIMAEWRAWPEVEAAGESMYLYSVSLDILESVPAHCYRLRGIPEALLRRYAVLGTMDAGCSNAIPIILSAKYTRLEYDVANQKVKVLPASRWQGWAGKPAVIRLGDNYASVARFEQNYTDPGGYETRPVSEDILALRRKQIDDGYRFQYDPVLHGVVLPLSGCVAGVHTGGEVLIPIDVARQCKAWLTLRDAVSKLGGDDQDETLPEFTSRGRRSTRENEFEEGIVLVKPGADVEAVAKRISDLGFSAVTRTQLFEAQARMFETGLRVARRVAYALGGVILFLAMGLLWNTISRIVSDSRVDIGLFRALGATRQDVRRLFLTEAAMLGGIGTMTGILVGWSVAGLISHFVLRYVRNNLVSPEELLTIPDSIFSFHVGFSALVLLGGVALAALAGWRPAARAANIDPVKALKRES